MPTDSDPYRTPEAPLTLPPSAKPGTRPILVLLTFAFCWLQLLGVIYAMHDNHLLDLIDRGYVSPLQALTGFAFPLLLFLGGLALYFMRRIALVFFGAYFLWGVVKFESATSLVSPLSLLVALAILVYAIALEAGKRLR